MREGLAAFGGLTIGAFVGAYCGWHLPDPWAHPDAVGVEYAGLRALCAYIGIGVCSTVGAIGAVKTQEHMF